MKKFLAVLFIGVTFIAFPASAALVSCGQTGGAECTVTDLALLVIRIINQLLSWAGLVAILVVVWGGWNMVTAAGNSEKIDDAKSTVSRAVIGLLLVFASFVLVNLVVMSLTGYKFNFDCKDDKSIMRFLFNDKCTK